LRRTRSSAPFLQEPRAELLIASQREEASFGANPKPSPDSPLAQLYHFFNDLFHRDPPPAALKCRRALFPPIPRIGPDIDG